MKEIINNYKSIDKNNVYQKYIQHNAIIILIVLPNAFCIVYYFIVYYFSNAYITIMQSCLQL